MNNPFTENTPQHEFFKQMTDAINDWMLKQYPTFDTELVNKIKELRKLQDEIKLSFHNHRQAVIKDKEETVKYCIGQINEFLEKDYPEISKKLKASSILLEKAVEKHDKNSKDIEKKLKTLIQSDTLCEDVYKLRDEFREVKKFMDGFKDNVKKAFKI